MRDALLCESFDANIPDSYRVIQSDADLLSRQSCVTSDGDGSTLSSSALKNQAAEVQMPLAEEVSGGSLYARLRVYVPSGHEVSDRMALFSVRPSLVFSTDQKTVRLLDKGGLAFQFNADDAIFSSKPDVLPKDTWTCVELELDIAEAGAARLLVEGEPVITAEGSTIPSAGSFRAMAAFGGAGKTQVPMNVAVDDLIVATSPIGCE